MTVQSKEQVIICEDMACVIINEVSRETAYEVRKLVNKTPEKGVGNIVEQYYRFNPDDKWWIFELDEDKTLEKCDKW